MKLRNVIFCVLCLSFCCLSIHAQSKVVRLAAVKFDKETTAILNNIKLEYFTMSKDGYFKPGKGYKIMYDESSEVVNLTPVKTIAKRGDDSLELAPGIKFQCYGCTEGGGCKVASDYNKDNSISYWCVGCSGKGGCVGNVIVDSKKKILDKLPY